MNQRILSLCGLVAPLLFVFMTVLGAAIRPGYSHLADTVSELFSPGSPNKPLLDTLHTIFALLFTLFGVGILQYVRKSGRSRWTGILGAALYIAAGLVSLTTAAIFPQDPWGSPPTFPGQMHITLTGVVGLLSLLSMLLIGWWFNRAGIFPGFWIYTLITAGIVVLSVGFFIANMGTALMGLTERITILPGFLWMFILAASMFSHSAQRDA